MWIDSHCHITADEFREDRSEVLERAASAGVETVIAIGAGYGLEHNERALELAARDPRLFATVGVHPHDAEQLDDEGRKRLRQWLRRPRVVAVGECGLDYFYMNSPRDIQREVFAEQLALAREFELPVVIHVRDRGEDAYRDLMAIWKREGGDRLAGLLHCYSHDLPFARRAVDAGFYVSFSGILTFKRARRSPGGGGSASRGPAAGGDRRSSALPGRLPGQAKRARPRAQRRRGVGKGPGALGRRGRA